MPPISQEQLVGDICKFVTSLLGRPCSPADDLMALGVDSITFLEVIIFIEKRCKIPLPLEMITAQPITTAKALAHLLASLHPALEVTEA